MRKFLLLIICGIVTLITSCNKIAIQSFWNNGVIKIDAVDKDWEQHLIWNERNKTGLGVANDDGSLYLCLTSCDRTLHRQMLISGFTVCIFQKGSKSQNFGIKFPQGIKGQNFQSAVMSNDQRDQGRFEPGRRGQENSESDFLEQFNALQTELLLLGPDEEQVTLVPLENDLGLEVKISHNRQQLVYELKIPFRIISQYLLVEGVSIEKPLTIHFKTDIAEMPSRHLEDRPDRFGGIGEPEGGMGGFGGGMGGPGRRMGAPGDGMGRPGNQDISRRAFSYKIIVTLAKNQ
jgi:hypothetical protein